MSCDGKSPCCKQQAADSDYLVCTCMGVLKSEIEQAIQQGNRTFQELSDLLGVGTGCSSCVQEVLQLLQNAKNSNCCKN